MTALRGIRALASTVSSTSLQAALPDAARGVRAAVVMLVPFYFARALGRPELAWTALGGWLCTLADPGGARGTRARALLSFASVGALLVGGSEILAGSAWTAALVLALATFALSLLRAAGGTAARVGTLLAMTTAIACTRARTIPLHDALCFEVGALAAALLSSVVWPVWTHLPVRRAIAAVYGALAAYAAEVEQAISAGLPGGDVRWSAMVREHHWHIRDALESARAIAVALRARRVGETRLGSNVRSLLGAAEAQFPLLGTAVQEVEELAPEARIEAGATLRTVIADDRDVEHVLVTRAIRGRDADVCAEGRPGGSESALATQPVFGRLGAMSHAALELAHAVDAPQSDVSAASPVGDNRAHRGISSWRESARAIRDALSLRSTIFRHAFRAACAALVASLLGSAVSPHQYWVSLTALAVLQPYPGATMKRAGERVFGTILGSALAAVIVCTVRSTLVLSALLLPLSIAAVATRPRSYRLFTFFLTPVFVVLAERHFGDWLTAAERAGDAILGGAVALVAGVFVFPETERERLPQNLERLLEALATYAAQVLEGHGAPRPSAIEADGNATARRAVGIAFGDAETSLERYLAEPRRDQESAADAMLLVTYARRLATALTALDMLGATQTTGSAIDRAAVATYVGSVIERAAARVRGEGPAPALQSPAPAKQVTPTDAALKRVLEWAALMAGLGVAAREQARSDERSTSWVSSS
jgi:uncharacterized membrane protein YccC